MPKDFKKKYPNNVCIIDCTELKIQVPSSLVKQSQSYSNHKSTNTLKSLVGVDAKGGGGGERGSSLSPSYTLDQFQTNKLFIDVTC